mmetsp:Transcript_23708/g.52026  ORF Transcript_23708/g.52026 Transcript_23708/m.52026 type:complete len:226 (+) Transcript_23708:4028-4705(+)
MRVHCEVLTSASTMALLRSSGSCDTGSSTTLPSVPLHGTGTEKLLPASLYHMVPSELLSTKTRAPVSWSGGSMMVRRCRGTRAPAISTSHSSSLQSSSCVSHAMWPVVCVSSGHSSLGAILHSREPGLLTPQCSTTSLARSVMRSTLTGAMGCSCLTTASSSLLSPSAKVRRHLVVGSSANCCTRKSSGFSLLLLLDSERTGAALTRLIMSKGLRRAAFPKGWPT